MKITAVRRIAIASVGVLAIVGAASCSSTEAKAKADTKKVERSLHSAVVKAYQDSKSAVDKAADKISDGSRSAYDRAKADLEAFGADLDDAPAKVGPDARRGYRDLDHRLDAFGRDVDRHMHKAGNDVGDAELDAWHDILDSYHRVSNSIHHVIDKLT